MQHRHSIAQAIDSASAGLAVPHLAKAGAVVIALGLIADLAVHALVPHAHDGLHAGFPIDEHLAHLVVVVGMALALAGIVADGFRAQRRLVRQEGTTRHAIR